jgi:hypothetical protein
MKRVERIEIDGQEVLIETSPIELPPRRGGADTEQVNIGNTIEQAKNGFDEAMRYARVLAEGTIKQIKGVGKDAIPDTVEIEFGVKLNAKTGVITEVGGEAQFTMTLTYHLTKHQG